MTAVINLLDFILPATIVVTDQTAKALPACKSCALSTAGRQAGMNIFFKFDKGKYSTRSKILEHNWYKPTNACAEDLETMKTGMCSSFFSKRIYDCQPIFNNLAMLHVFRVNNCEIIF